jgi:hypothetical protein
MAVWSITIVEGQHPEDPASFVCELQPDAPAGTIYAQPGDAITWSNTTSSVHQPWPADPGASQGTPWPDSKVLPRGSPFYLSDPLDPRVQGEIVMPAPQTS